VRRTHPGLAGRPVYLDYNATTPVDPRVVEAMVPYLTSEFGNPSSSHPYGARAHDAVDAARAQVASLVGAPTGGRVVFTASGSEADALAIRGTVLARAAFDRSHIGRAHVITQATEHPAVLAACADLHELHGVEVTVLPVDSSGLVDPAAVAAAITDRTILVSIMHANNETGTIQPIAEIADVAHRHDVLVHCDAAQSIGKIAVRADSLGVDLLTVVGHKMYAPKGIAALYVRDGVALRPIVGGGGQEGGLRSGTENVPNIVALGRAAELASQALSDEETERLTRLRHDLEHRLQALLPGRVRLNGHPVRRLPNTVNVSIEGTLASAVLSHTDAVAASAGSACHEGRDTPSPVLTAMGVAADQALAALRISLGRWTTASDVAHAAAVIADAASGWPSCPSHMLGPASP
jgi:cysteine desulfurase